MSAETSIICDGCSQIIGAAKTARAARAEIRRDGAGKVGLPGGKDICKWCMADTQPSDTKKEPS